MASNTTVWDILRSPKVIKADRKGGEIHATVEGGFTISEILALRKPPFDVDDGTAIGGEFTAKFTRYVIKIN